MPAEIAVADYDQVQGPRGNLPPQRRLTNRAARNVERLRTCLALCDQAAQIEDADAIAGEIAKCKVPNRLAVAICDRHSLTSQPKNFSASRTDPLAPREVRLLATKSLGDSVAAVRRLETAPSSSRHRDVIDTLSALCMRLYAGLAQVEKRLAQLEGATPSPPIAELIARVNRLEELAARVYRLEAAPVTVELERRVSELERKSATRPWPSPSSPK